LTKNFPRVTETEPECACDDTDVKALREGIVSMVGAADYSAIETLRNGDRIEIRALRPTDRTDLLLAIERTSAQSLYRRFFGAKRSFTEEEIAFFLNVDFVKHVALVAVPQEHLIIAGGRYVVFEPGRAEVAFAVVDDYQGRGIGQALMRHLAAIARDTGLVELTAEVLPDNAAMLKVFEKSGLPFETRRDTGVVHVALRLT
jgi:GNAT superfamily N-acetyltransferase